MLAVFDQLAAMANDEEMIGAYLTDESFWGESLNVPDFRAATLSAFRFLPTEPFILERAAIISVSDNSRGIPEDQIEHVLEPFPYRSLGSRSWSRSRRWREVDHQDGCLLRLSRPTSTRSLKDREYGQMPGYRRVRV